MTVAVILGSAFREPVIAGRQLEPLTLLTRFGGAVLHRYPREDREAWVMFRHGTPHSFLPNQIPFQAQAVALGDIGCQSLLVTSSVGGMDPDLPLDVPLLLSDILMPDNSLPDGSACTVFPEPTVGQGHLVLDEGVFSRELSTQVERLAARAGHPVAGRAVFAYTKGPRTKTAAENAMWAELGGQVNSMTVAPEVVLANELGIPVAGLVVGHKYSVPGVHDRLDHAGISHALRAAWKTLDDLARVFLEEAQPVPFANRLFRL